MNTTQDLGPNSVIVWKPQLLSGAMDSAIGRQPRCFAIAEQRMQCASHSYMAVRMEANQAEGARHITVGIRPQSTILLGELLLKVNLRLPTPNAHPQLTTPMHPLPSQSQPQPQFLYSPPLSPDACPQNTFSFVHSFLHMFPDTPVLTPELYSCAPPASLNPHAVVLTPDPPDVWSMQVGQAVMGLQKALPQARVVYCSATGASEPRNLGYMDRLGLWGPGTPSFSNFQVCPSTPSPNTCSHIPLFAPDTAIGQHWTAFVLD